jgi:hypothetical protein
MMCMILGRDFQRVSFGTQHADTGFRQNHADVKDGGATEKAKFALREVRTNSGVQRAGKDCDTRTMGLTPA